MNPISIPNHLVTAISIAIFGIAVILFFRRWMNKSAFIGTMIFLFFYVFVVGTATYDDIYSQWNLNQFDLNQDGFFSGSELTQEQKVAAFQLTNDVGRNFSFITGAIAASILGLAAYFLSKLYDRAIQSRKNT